MIYASLPWVWCEFYHQQVPNRLLKVAVIRVLLCICIFPNRWLTVNCSPLLCPQDMPLREDVNEQRSFGDGRRGFWTDWTLAQCPVQLWISRRKLHIHSPPSDCLLSRFAVLRSRSQQTLRLQRASSSGDLWPFVGFFSSISSTLSLILSHYVSFTPLVIVALSLPRNCCTHQYDCK